MTRKEDPTRAVADIIRLAGAGWTRTSNDEDLVIHASGHARLRSALITQDLGCMRILYPERDLIMILNGDVPVAEACLRIIAAGDAPSALLLLARTYEHHVVHDDAAVPAGSEPILRRAGLLLDATIGFVAEQVAESDFASAMLEWSTTRPRLSFGCSRRIGTRGRPVLPDSLQRAAMACEPTAHLVPGGAREAVSPFVGGDLPGNRVRSEVTMDSQMQKESATPDVMARLRCIQAGHEAALALGIS